MRVTRRLARLLADPATAGEVRGGEWGSILTAARAESLLGSLAWRLDSAAVPEAAATILDGAKRDAHQARTQALWEAEMARRALMADGIQPILLKGTAYAAAGLMAGQGRSIGDLDILVPRDRLPATENALIAAGWEWVKPDPYDDLYYRQWMHELPPLIHRERDRMIDVHHTILPLTARRRPDAEALLEGSVELASGLWTLGPGDMIVHAAAHLFADGDLAGGMRNLWDIACLLRDFDTPGFREGLAERAALHQMTEPVARALRLTNRLYASPLDDAFERRAHPLDRWFEMRLLARNGWGQPTRPILRQAFYVRSHWLRMPPLMLARHLIVKARR